MLKRISLKLFNLLWLMRLPIVSVTILLTLISLNLSDVENYQILIPLACISFAGYIQNDIFDLEIDSISAPYRPLPSGQISIHEAKFEYALFVVLGLIIAVVLANPFYIAYLLTILEAFYLYTKYCKSNWVLKNLSTAVISTTVIFIPLLFQGKVTMNVLQLGGMAFLFTFGREIFMDIRDRKGDNIIPILKRPHILQGVVLSILSLTASFVAKEIFFLDFNILRYIIYLMIIFLIYHFFKKSKSKYWIISESMKIIFIYDLITIYIKSR